MTALGATTVRAQHPHTRPERLARSPRPLGHPNFPPLGGPPTWRLAAQVLLEAVFEETSNPSTIG